MHKSGVVIESSEFATRRTQETKQDPTCAYIACAWMHKRGVVRDATNLQGHKNQ